MGLTAVVFHVRPDISLLQTVGEGAVPDIVALLLLHYMHTHLDQAKAEGHTVIMKLKNRFLCP